MKSPNEKHARFMALFLPAQPRLERFVRAMTSDLESAKDIVGETILIAFQRLETLRSDEAFLSFLFTIATRVARRHVTKRPLEALEVDNLHDPSSPADVAADIGILRKALESLPQKQREAVLLFEIAGFSTQEVRDVQGGTLVAVRVRLARGRKRLAELLGVTPPDDAPRTKERDTDRRPGVDGTGRHTPMDRADETRLIAAELNGMKLDETGTNGTGTNGTGTNGTGTNGTGTNGTGTNGTGTEDSFGAPVAAAHSESGTQN